MVISWVASLLVAQTPAMPQLITTRWVVRLYPELDPMVFAEQTGLRLVGRDPELVDTYLFEADAIGRPDLVVTTFTAQLENNDAIILFEHEETLARAVTNTDVATIPLMFDSEPIPEALNAFDPVITIVPTLYSVDGAVSGERTRWILTVDNHGRKSGNELQIAATFDERLAIEQVTYPEGEVILKDNRLVIVVDTLESRERYQILVDTITNQIGISFRGELCLTAREQMIPICTQSASMIALPVGWVPTDYDALPDDHPIVQARKTPVIATPMVFTEPVTPQVALDITPVIFESAATRAESKLTPIPRVEGEDKFNNPDS